MKKLLLFAGVFLLHAALSAQMKELSFYEVRPKTGEIIIDGKISKEEWQNVPVHSDYYEYYKDNPRPGALKTTFQMVYDDKGIYMAVVNFDDNGILSGIIVSDLLNEAAVTRET